MTDGYEPPVTVRHAPAHDRYEAVSEGHVVGFVEYRDAGDHVVMHHTYTEPVHRGQAVAAHVVAGALDDLRSRGRRVEPTCWYVADFISSHPEYRDLLVDV